MNYTTFTAALSEGSTSNVNTIIGITGIIVTVIIAIYVAIMELKSHDIKNAIMTFLFTMVIGSVVVGIIYILFSIRAENPQLPTERQQPGIVSDEDRDAHKTVHYLEETSVSKAVESSGMATIAHDEHKEPRRGVKVTLPVPGSMALTTANTSPTEADVFAVTETATGVIHRQCMVNTTSVHKDAGTVDFRLVCDRNGTQVPLKLKNTKEK